MNIEIIITADGSNTLKDKEKDETYHSIYGAMNESLYVFIEQGLKNIKMPVVNIFEMGFGSGLNAFLTLIYSMEKEIQINYTSLELFPITDHHVIKSLNYPELSKIFEGRKYFEQLHYCNWNEEIKITSNFYFRRINKDIRNYKFDRLYDLVYYDAFSPGKQPELWSENIFKNLNGSVTQNGILVTYTASGNVRRTLQNASFKVEKIKGSFNKRHMLRGIKII